MAFTLLETLSPAECDVSKALRRRVGGFSRVVVAYSGGVDSALVAAIAAEQLGEQATAVTGVSPALAPRLRLEASTQARWMGIHQLEVSTAELNDPAYARNPEDRCYACKRELHHLLRSIASSGDGAVVLDGVNYDDLGDHRPGIRAAKEHGVHSPLAELAIGKQVVRQLSRALGLPWWDKPAQPCLASRFPYGEPITGGRLERVGTAEEWLFQQGWMDVRVRCQGQTARIELPASQLNTALLRWSQPEARDELVKVFLDLGFTAVSIDLEGLVRGKLNRERQG
jgi:pyridinium-3,5-biscarboxylic acid mononucleotide sulfurtransferase